MTISIQISSLQRSWKTSLVLAAALLSVGLKAQKAFIPEPGEGFHFATSSLQVQGAPGSYLPSWQANSQELLLFREHIIGLSHFSVAYGAGYSAHFFHGNLHIDVAEDGTQTLVDLTGTNYQRNRLALEFADAALELRYRSKANRKGRYNRVYLGVVGGYRTDAYSYYEDENYRVKFYNVKGFNRYRYGAFAKVGRGPFNLYGQWSASPLVQSGPMLPAWSDSRFYNIGLSISL